MKKQLVTIINVYDRKKYKNWKKTLMFSGFVWFFGFFLTLLLFQKTFTTVHTTDRALKFFPHHITCCHPCTSSTWNYTWSKSCIQPHPLLALLSLHYRVEHSGGSCLSFWHVFLYPFVHEHTLPPMTSTVPTLSLCASHVPANILSTDKPHRVSSAPLI